jgi:acetyl-CoA carboxylase alpha subunit
MRVVEAWDETLRSTDPLRFPGYDVPHAQDESVRTALIELRGKPAVWIDCDFRRVGGTMGAVAGERIVRAFDRAVRLGAPVVETVSTGGARLQEGMVSLVQMPRTVAAASRHSAAALRSAAHLRSPTTGGVFASFVSRADLRAAEPEATIGFGGPRVVAEVTGSFPPSTSHTAESALRHGLVDALVPLDDTWHWLASAVGLTGAGALVLPPGRPQGLDPTPPARSPYQHLRRARGGERPSGLEWAAWLTDSWTEIKGPDPSVRAGLAAVGGERIAVIAMDRFAGAFRAGAPGPGAYRLAQRTARLAGRLRLPVLTLVDTPGADPRPESEAGGLAAEIAATLAEFAELPTPSVCLVVGEGGSGGAMALAHTDRVLMLNGAAFSVIGPEAGAAILYRDASRAPQLARSLRMTPADLLRLGVVDRVLPEVRTTVRDAVLDALRSAMPGTRDTRPDMVTAAALTA